MFEQSTPYYKRYLCGPKLQGGLTGSAKRLVIGQSAEWLSFNGGVQHLLSHLRKCLGKPQLPELTDLLMKYFKGSRRRAGESMGEYITRKCEVYVRAQQAMSRLQPFYESYSTSGSGTRNWPGTWSWGNESRRSSIDSQAVRRPMKKPRQPRPPVRVRPGLHRTRRHGLSTSWGWYGSSPWWSYNGWDWSHREGRSSTSGSLPELVPDFVQGWHLLQDAGLDRNLVMTAR